MIGGARYWDERGLAFQKVHHRLRIIREMFDRIPGPVTTVLDLGCGPATLRQVLPPHVEYFGVDFAAAIVEAFADPAHFEVADFNVNPSCFDTKTFDVLICSGIFEYVRDPHRFVELLERKATIGGHLILSYTNRQHFRSIPAMVRGEHPTYVDPHYNFTSIPQTMRLLSAHRFQLVSYTGITHRQKRVLPLFSRFTHFPLSMLNRQFVFLWKYAKGKSTSGSARLERSPATAGASDLTSAHEQRRSQLSSQARPLGRRPVIVQAASC